MVRYRFNCEMFYDWRKDNILSVSFTRGTRTPAKAKNNLTTDKKDEHRYKNPCLSVCIRG